VPGQRAVWTVVGDEFLEVRQQNPFPFGPRGSTVSGRQHSTTGRMRADSESDGTVQVT
jgi:hypothetical protein